jgi:hypothetical protein
MRFRPEIALAKLQMAELLLDHYPEERSVALDHLDFAIGVVPGDEDGVCFAPGAEAEGNIEGIEPGEGNYLAFILQQGSADPL